MSETLAARADLHVHSKYSDRPSEWFLRRIGAPECFVEPLDVYRRAKARGMQYVTIADHNCISGALEIGHLPGTFLSCEVTTYFPEDGCKIHCLVCGISETQFAMIQELRRSAYDLRTYLAEENIFCSITHPLFSVNDRLTADHVEKLLVLFKRFELMNGSRDRQGAVLMRAVLDHLTPGAIERMADRHGLEPWGPEPWAKWATGGSDDHSGVYIASAYTQTPAAGSVVEFLDHLGEGRHEPGGEFGGSLRLAHSLYHIASSYYRSRLLALGRGGRNILGELLENLLHRSSDESRGIARFVPSFARNFVKARRLRKLSELERLLAEEMSNLTMEAAPALADPAAERRTFETTCRIVHLLSYNLLAKLAGEFAQGRLLEGLQAAAALGPVLLSAAPHLAAFSTQHKDHALLQAVAARFPEAGHAVRRPDRRAWITDTYGDVNGVCRTIESVARAAGEMGQQLTVVTCLERSPSTTVDLKNFPPVGTFSLPEYDAQKLAFPPFLEMIEWLECEGYGELVLSTPGPLGLTGLAAARVLGLTKTGIYHTDFPLLVRHLTLDHAMEQATWRYLIWFYSQMDVVFVPSDFYRRLLIRNGLDGSRVVVMGHGVDRERFNERKRDADFWRHYGLPPGFTFLYAGRISQEKNVETALEAFRSLKLRLPGANLAVVGDGPLRRQLEIRYRDPRIVFTGFLEGEELARAYASSDAFVFPSVTDTFGLVVLEALASGLPAIVSDFGGPPEIIRDQQAGIVVEPCNAATMADAMERLARDPPRCAAFREAALRTATENTWQRVAERLWNHRPLARRNEFEAAPLGEPQPTGGLIVMELA